MKSTFLPRIVFVSAFLLALSACGHAPGNAAFLNRGGPESLLDVSSEVVSLSVAQDSDLKDLSAWIERDQPTRAELNCNPSEKRCKETQKILDLHGVPFANGSSTGQSVTLTYARILARDCDQRFVDNVPNHHNAYHPAFGCAVAANMVQQVTDKQEFISPNLSDDPSAARAVNDMYRAYTPRPVVAPYNVDESIVSKSKSE